MNQYPAFDMLHTEEEVREHATTCINTKIDNLSQVYNTSEIQELEGIKEAVEQGSFLGYLEQSALEQAITEHMEEYIRMSTPRELQLEDLMNLIIYTEVYQTYCK